MSHNSNIPGWAGDIYEWLEKVATKHIPQGGTYMEVGTFMGASLAHMGTIRRDINLISVDPWLDLPSQGYTGAGPEYQAIQDQHGGLFFSFLHFMTTQAPDVLKRTRVTRGTCDTVSILSPVDVLFIDGAHDLESVTKDLEAFRHLVKPGGIVSGHDWPDGGVHNSVLKFYSREQVKIQDSCWWIEV